jgi:hypothetical protein
MISFSSDEEEWDEPLHKQHIGSGAVKSLYATAAHTVEPQPDAEKAAIDTTPATSSALGNAAADMWNRQTNHAASTPCKAAAEMAQTVEAPTGMLRQQLAHRASAVAARKVSGAVAVATERANAKTAQVAGNSSGITAAKASAAAVNEASHRCHTNSKPSCRRTCQQSSRERNSCHTETNRQSYSAIDGITALVAPSEVQSQKPCTSTDITELEEDSEKMISFSSDEEEWDEPLHKQHIGSGAVKSLYATAAHTVEPQPDAEKAAIDTTPATSSALGNAAADMWNRQTNHAASTPCKAAAEMAQTVEAPTGMLRQQLVHRASAVAARKVSGAVAVATERANAKTAQVAGNSSDITAAKASAAAVNEASHRCHTNSEPSCRRTCQQSSRERNSCHTETNRQSCG